MFEIKIEKLDDWHYLHFSPASLSIHWSNLMSLPPNNLVSIIGRIGGKQPQKIFSKYKVQDTSFYHLNTISSSDLVVVPLDEFSKFALKDAVYEISFLDVKHKPTQQQLNLIDGYEYFDLIYKKKEDLRTFMECCESNFAYCYDDGRHVDILLRNTISPIPFVKSFLEYSLCMRRKDSEIKLNDNQVQCIMDLYDGYLTFDDRSLVITKGKIRFTCWGEIVKSGDNRIQNACDKELIGNDISISDWEERTIPEYQKDKIRPIACSLFVLIILTIIFAALFGLYKLVEYLISLI